MLVVISGDVTNSAAGDGANVQCMFGTGTAPVNGAAVTGTAIGSLKKWLSSPTTPDKGHFVCAGIVVMTTVPATQAGVLNFWIDVAFDAVTGGTATLADVDISAHEL
jgi:hypothetical protein